MDLAAFGALKLTIKQLFLKRGKRSKRGTLDPVDHLTEVWPSRKQLLSYINYMFDNVVPYGLQMKKRPDQVLIEGGALASVINIFCVFMHRSLFGRDEAVVRHRHGDEEVVRLMSRGG